MTDKETMAIIKQMVADGQISQEVAEKYFPELKPEDERIINALIRLLRQCAHDGYDNVVEGVGIPEAIAWLEKQGERTKWKPTEEQMKALRAARSIDGVNHVVLASLIYDLEKLMK